MYKKINSGENHLILSTFRISFFAATSFSAHLHVFDFEDWTKCLISISSSPEDPTSDSGVGASGVGAGPCLEFQIRCSISKLHSAAGVKN